MSITTPTTLDDLKALSDADLSTLEGQVYQERQRRYQLAQAPAQVDAALKSYQTAAGTTPTAGAAWKQPTGALDAYPSGTEVTYKGKTYVSTTPANVWEPGVAGWREKTADGAAPAAWKQPSGAADSYKKGDRVTYQGAVYTSLVDSNTWSPTDYPAGWKKDS